MGKSQIFGACCAVLASIASAQAPSASIKQGMVIGTTTMLPQATAPTNKFLGMPFAQSPPTRFGPPEEPSAFSGPLMAQAVKPSCIQQFVYPILTRNVTTGVFNSPPPPAGESEDCLYVNVYAPSTPAPPGGRAVMFWIYGGSFQFGTGTLMAYDGSAFAAYQDVVLVTFNYRTNVFGFSGSPDIDIAQRNPGFLDQRAALQWVQDNIAAFGGDPKKVTIFGESAGSISIDAILVTTPNDTAPFRAAILESGVTTYLSTNTRFTDPTPSWEALVAALNCTSGSDALACVRAAPALTIKSIIEHQALLFPPTVDNVTLPSDGALRRQNGNFAAVPILIGTNRNEGRIFELGMGQLGEFLDTLFGKTAPQIIPEIEKVYPPYPQANGYDSVSSVATLANFQCGSALMANETAAQGVPTWRYFFNATFPNLSPFGGLLEVYHSSEISLVWQTYPGGPINPTSPTPLIGDLPTGTKPTAQQVALGKFMNGAWADFAKNPYAGPGWNQLGTFNGQDLGVIGCDGNCAGVEIINRTTVDDPCQLFLPAFRAVTGNVYGLTDVSED